MAKTIAAKIRIDMSKKVFIDGFCNEQGIAINEFIEMAVEHEIERRLLKAGPGIFLNYGKRKSKAVDFDKVFNRL